MCYACVWHVQMLHLSSLPTRDDGAAWTLPSTMSSCEKCCDGGRSINNPAIGQCPQLQARTRHCSFETWTKAIKPRTIQSSLSIMAAGGFKMSLGGLKAKPGLKAVAAKRDTKPKKALLGDDEPEDTNKAQEIAGFDAAEGGAIDINGPKEKKGPLVIPTLPNRSWRDEARKKQLERAPHTQQQQQQNGDVVMDEPEAEVVYGLTVPTKPSAAATAEPAAAAEAMDVDPSDTLTDAQRLDKQALESLLTGKATDTQRVVPAISDEEALRNDLLDAPDEPDVAAYEATPIEGFGLAMLRGMGWKDSDGEARKGGPAKAPAEVKRRPALLGIGRSEEHTSELQSHVNLVC